MCNENKIEDLDQENQSVDDVGEASSINVSESLREIPNSSRNDSTATSRVSNGNSGSDGGLSERLRNIFSNQGDGDFLLQNNRENNVLQWLQALDLQVMGACRADERLKPFLKLNVSGGVAEDHLLAQLSQHFEVPEVGMLARCLCIPLVSIRVGRVTRQGSLLCPAGTRGNLNLTLLPSSGLHISFVGDDGCIERLATLTCNSESLVVIEEIPADKSGRSFLVKIPDGQVSYFWCSEKSKLLGFELLAKMKNLLWRKPSLAQLTGISDSRLDCFATYLRSCLGGIVSNDSAECESNFQVPSSSVKPSRSRCINGQAGKPHSFYQGSLSPRSNSFKDGVPRNSSSIRSGTREKLRRRGDIHCIFSAVDASTSVTEVFSTNQTENRKVSEGTSCPFLPLSPLDSICKSAFTPSSSLPSLGLPSPPASIFSPYYCWCPPCTSGLQYTITPPHLLISSAAMPSSSLSSPKLPFDRSDVPPLDFPALLPEPVVRVPLPVSSFITVCSSQQIPIFTPLMCDPIVHIPVIDVCYSGQGYLVSAGPTMIQETESLLEKNARETLRLLLSSTQTNPQLIEVLPTVFTSTDTMVVGSRGLYSGTRDVDSIANTIAAMGLASLPHTRSLNDHNLETQMDGNRDSEGCDTKDSTIVNDVRQRLDAA